ncbi:MAG TPA: 3D domain-containing protein [Candidatus Acidoferrales bacterium]|nr:3D domain-containing protein [Candidatus Acidoferrales bacterium]
MAPQKGAGLIERDHQATLVAVSLLALGAFFFSVLPAAALARHHHASATPPLPSTPPVLPTPSTEPTNALDDTSAAVPVDVSVNATQAPSVSSATVTLVVNGSKSTYMTNALTIGAFLKEHDIVPAPGDKLSAAPEDFILDGMTISYRSAATVSKNALSGKIAAGKYALLKQRKLPLRVAPLHIAGSLRTVLAAHLIRPVRTAVVGEYVAFAEMARRGFDSTVRAADTMLRMVATAYTASCDGCSGITAMGYRAGHGIVAVDPRVIPLGTHLFIPGYGPAIAGDTGGAIKGSRIDLGFNSFSDALQFGRREITVYVLNTRAAARH